MAERPPEPDDIYDVAPDQPRVAAGSRATPHPSVAPPVAPPVASRALNYRTPKDDAPGRSDPETIKNFYMPIWLLGGGVAIEVVAAMLSSRPQAALRDVGLQII